MSKPGVTRAELNWYFGDSQISKHRICVVVPAHNEAGTIGEIIAQLFALDLDLAVFIVDDASTDETAAIVSQSAAHLLSLSSWLGAWGATQAGIRRAHYLGFDYVVTMDADGQHPVEAIPELINAVINEEINLVIGSHTARGSLLRQLAWKAIRWVSRVEVEDITSGFRAYDRTAIQIASSERASYLDYQDLGVLILALEGGIRIGEVPVKMRQREQGSSRIFKTWFAVAIYMLTTLLLGLVKSRGVRLSDKAAVQGGPT